MTTAEAIDLKYVFFFFFAFNGTLLAAAQYDWNLRNAAPGTFVCVPLKNHSDDILGNVPLIYLLGIFSSD